MKMGLKSFIIFCLFVSYTAFGIVGLYFLYSTARHGVSDGFASKVSGVGEVVSSMASVADMKEILKLDAESAKESALYLKYHKALEGIVNDVEVDFLYLFFYGGEKDILYMVDAEDMNSEIWCAPNSIEESVEEDLKAGLFNAFRRSGGLTPLINTKEWGYMRSGTYPMAEGGERSYYMVGVDLKIDEIVGRALSVMTKAFLGFLVIGIFSIWIASMVADMIVKSVISMRNKVLMIGVGINPDLSDMEKLSPEIQEAAFSISEFAGGLDSDIKSIGDERRRIEDMMFLSNLGMEIMPKDSSFVFTAKNLKKENTLLYSAMERKGKFFAWSYESSSCACKDLLMESALRREIPALSPELLAELGLKDISIFAGQKNLYRHGAEILASFEIENELVSGVEFNFEDGVVLKGERRK